MTVKKIKVKFNNVYEGELISKTGCAAVGAGEGRLAAYDMLLGALATCLYSTFLDVIKKKRLEFNGAEFIITGEKRETVPMTLKWVNVNIEINNPSNEKGFQKSAELAAKYCSVYETISRVADMNMEVNFNY